MLLFSACSGEQGGNYGYGPLHIRTNPYNNQSGVSPSIVIRAAFNQDIQAGSINSTSFTLSGPAGNVAGSVLYDWQYKSARFTPTIPLSLSSTYTASLASSILDNQGHTIPGYSWTFTTGSGGWGLAQLLENDNTGTAGAPHIAVSKNGDAMAVWHQSDGTRNNIWASHYTVAGGWEAPTKVELDDFADALNPRVAMDDNGNAIVVWQQMETAASFVNIWANRYVAGSGWSGTVKIESEDYNNAANPDVVMDGAGNAIAVWENMDVSIQGIFANRYVVGSGWQISLVIDGTTDAAANPKVVMDGSGNAIAIWSQLDASFTSIWSNRYTAGSWGTAATIESHAQTTSDYDIAINSSGYALVVWIEYVTGADVWTNQYIPGSGWQTPTSIETDSSIGSAMPNITIDSAGNAIAVWVQLNGSTLNTYTNRYTASVGWGIYELIHSYPAGAVNKPDISVDGNGNAIAVWSQSDGVRDNLVAKRYYSGSGWGITEQIETDNLGSTSAQQIAIDNKGDAITIWAQSDGTRNNIWANHYTFVK